MLLNLSIQNVALIERLDITFSNGFHVLTGETGAGKSIIIDAVNFVLGERASRELIKSGAQKASVQAVFSLPDYPALLDRLDALGIEPEENELLLSREFNISGKSTCRINGMLVNLSSLKSVSDLLVDIHGQHEHQSLLQPEQHISYLDDFNFEQIKPLRERTQVIYKQMQELQKQLLSGFTSEQERVRRMDLLKYQIQEIEAAQLTSGEEEDLDAELQILSNAQQILTSLEGSYDYLHGDEGGLLQNLNGALRLLEGIQAYHADYAQVYNSMQEAYYSLEDAGFTLRSLKSDFEFQPERLNEVEERLGVIQTLKRKYGNSIDEILAFLSRAQEEHDNLLFSETRREKLQAQLNEYEDDYFKAAKNLTNTRKSLALELSKALTLQLNDLGMKSAQFEVRFEKLSAPSPDGMDQVEFLLSTNVGEPVKPLQKVASGGELSRIMLAFKTLHIGNIPTVIFDEIDTGISGHTATVVGQKMLQIAKNHQVLCVTHLAQIAAMANTHYLVKKTEEAGKTTSSVLLLDMDGRIAEIAHIMGATENDTRATEHAKELLLRAKEA
ncbi:DNA repair protein RecN [Eubacteriales bacterium OttesenSCG-928-K08]|nr:DNA repair protein RecN [Eubacteriales bacterium OttesenSCG-928-K08]